MSDEISSIQFKHGERVQVLTTQPIDRLLDYIVPPVGVSLGSFVMVPLGPRQVLGVVWGAPNDASHGYKLREISRVLDVPAMSAEMRSFLARMADYTVTAQSAMLRLATRVPGLEDAQKMQMVYQRASGAVDRMTPARQSVLDVFSQYPDRYYMLGELAKLAQVSSSVVKGLVSLGAIKAIEAPKDQPFAPLDAGFAPVDLTQGQAQVAAQLRQKIEAKSYSTTLLQGITGSGKTEVYFEAIAAAIEQGRQVLVMIPEIALTVEFMDRFAARFGARPAEWHSAITQSERRRTWHMVAQNKAQVVVGARSSLFLPFSNLGLIVVDEEHDPSYKQEEGVIYSARDMSVMRASLCGASVILASATPALETWVNAKTGKYDKLVLAQRFGAAGLPDLDTINMREQEMLPNHWISPALADAVQQRLDMDEQSLLFLNRRGYAPITICRACGDQISCPHCDAKLVEHRFRSELLCHQCGFSQSVPNACPSCGEEDKLAPIGPGVERLAEEAQERFPDARIAVLSSDMSLSPEALKAHIQGLAAGEADIIVGTQLVAKGHNFPLLTLVGVIDADIGLQGGDLRAAERTFQLMRQVAGRAGRADKKGLALLQSYQPDHPVMQAIIGGDEEQFWQAEADARELSKVPPFGRFVGIILSSSKPETALRVGRGLLQRSAPLNALGAQIYGPAPAPIARIKDRYRFRMLIQVPRNAPIQKAIKAWVKSVDLPKNTRLSVDIDPMTFF